MKKNIMNWVLIVVFLVGLASCSQLITKRHLEISKGTTFEQFNSVGVDFDETFNLEKMNEKYKADFKILTAKMKGAIKKEIYYYAFKNDTLIFWGHPYLFTRSENTTIREMGEEVYPKVKIEYGMDKDDDE
jgi:hypothetical protein